MQDTSSPQRELSPEERGQKDEILSTPVEQVTLGDGTTVADLVGAMSGMSIQARNIGLCAKVLDGKLIWAPMALSDGKLLLRNMELMKCIDLVTP